MIARSKVSDSVMLLTIDDDVPAVARSLAERKGISLGKAVPSHADRTTFAVPADAKPITNEDVARALHD